MLFRRGDGSSLAGDDGPIAAVPLGLNEGRLGFGQPPESQKRPGSAESRVTESRSLGQDELVLAERRGGIIANEGNRRETDPILERMGVGH